MRVAFDTTVMIDGLFVTGSASAKVLKEVKRGRLQVITSQSILGEFQAVIQNQRFRQPEIRAWLWTTGFSSLPNVTVVQPKDIPAVVPGDAMDDHVIAAAVAGNADYIVATDHHLLQVGQYKNIKIITPEEFLVVLGLAKTAPPPVARPDFGDGLAA